MCIGRNPPTTYVTTLFIGFNVSSPEQVALKAGGRATF